MEVERFLKMLSFYNGQVFLCSLRAQFSKNHFTNNKLIIRIYAHQGISISNFVDKSCKMIKYKRLSLSFDDWEWKGSYE